MLLVANLAVTKLCKKTKKWTKPWQMGTYMYLRVLSESYPMSTNMTGFRWFSKIVTFLYFWQVASALEGLMTCAWFPFYQSSYLACVSLYIYISIYIYMSIYIYIHFLSVDLSRYLMFIEIRCSESIQESIHRWLREQWPATSYVIPATNPWTRTCLTKLRS